MALGFFETDINGREVIAHLGDTGAFHTSLHLFLTMASDSTRRSTARESKAPSTVSVISLFEQFADRYFPQNPDTRRVPKDVAKKHRR